MPDGIVLYEKLGCIARLTANRPRYRNAQSRRMLEELDGALAEAAKERRPLVGQRVCASAMRRSTR